ncbi:hypothetical protein SAMN04488096_105147 [Mesonia phycicola]|uniref:TonB protein C-terminal n=1 Tax=Mesonia phycicola TaxID=579105 RepID=A0A1M6EM92_9FLAO|nr:hypothetical protein [Mesonia phycicola]SHI86350.1 hypothetical protein SAMN04488096_105147 [Mesonia phycicola]
MKKILFILTMFFFLGSYAQEKKEITTPVLTVKLLKGEAYSWDNYSILFKEVVADSRCPSDVTCVWAGEAKINITLTQNGKLIDSQEVVLANSEKNVTSFYLAEKSFRVYGLMPYPTTQMKKEKNIDYSIRLEIPSE